MADYYQTQAPTPQDFKDAHKGKKLLIIASGPSTANLIPYKAELKKHFDVVMPINHSVFDFFDQSDCFFAIEKNPQSIYNKMKQQGYRKDIPYFIHWKCFDQFPGDVKRVKQTRMMFDQHTDPFNYTRKDGGEGLITGPKDTKGIAAGTATMQAIHLAAIMGAGEIYLSGADLFFRDQDKDHYYSDGFFYRQSKTKLANRSPVVEITYNGKTYKSTEFFRESAKFIDSMVDQYLVPSGVKVFDFSNGLLQRPIPLTASEFFK